MKTAVAVLIAFLVFGLIGCQEQPTSPVSPGNLQKTAPSLSKSDGFDEFGYNYAARLFQGTGDGVDRILDGAVWGDPTYANDKLVMKWSKAWDDARFNGAPWTPDAWEDNEWNGNVPGGSGYTEHFKCVWVGPLGTSSPYWREGGYLIWGEFEAIMDFGSDPDHTLWLLAKLNPSGFGMTK